jgi:hypothetical protein
MVTIAAPTQADLALEKANLVRVGIAQIKRNIRELPAAEGRELVAALLEHPSGLVPSMRVGALLTAINRVGHGRAGKWISLAGVRSTDRHVGDLAPRQRLTLAQILRDVPCKR